MKILLGLLLLTSTSFAGQICGKIQAVSFPSYQFKVSDQNGKPVSVPVTAKVNMTEPIWEGENWGVEGHVIPIKVNVDSATGTVSTKATNISAPSRIKFPNFDCLDSFYSYEVEFNSKGQEKFDITKAGAKFEYQFATQSSTYKLPDPQSPYNVIVASLEVIQGVLAAKLNSITTANGTVVDISWDGTALTDAEVILMRSSAANGVAVSVYGLQNGDKFRIQSVAK